MPGYPEGIGLCSFAKSGAARLPALLCKDTSPSNYYIIFHCMRSTSWVTLQCWPSPRSVGRPSSSWLNDHPIEQRAGHVLRCGMGQGCCILTQLLAPLGEPDFSQKTRLLWDSNQSWALPGAVKSGFYLMPASTNTDTATLQKDVKNLSSHLTTTSLNNKS